MFEFLEPSFMRRAFLIIILIFPLFGLLGSGVVSSGMVFFSDSIAHGAFLGLVLGLNLGIIVPQWITTLVFAVVFSCIIALVRFYNFSSTDTVIGVFSSISVALGMLLLSKSGNLAQYSHIFVGDILTVTGEQIYKTLFLGFLILVLWWFQSNSVYLCQISEGLARTYGVKPLISNMIFMITLAILVSFSVEWLGVFLLNALLVLPAATSRMMAKNFLWYHFGAILLSLISGVLGLLISYYLDLHPSACIVVLSGIFYLLVLFYFKKRCYEEKCVNCNDRGKD